MGAVLRLFGFTVMRSCGSMVMRFVGFYGYGDSCTAVRVCGIRVFV